MLLIIDRSLVSPNFFKIDGMTQEPDEEAKTTLQIQLLNHIAVTCEKSLFWLRKGNEVKSQVTILVFNLRY
jgi:hypothetical protein